MGKYKNDPSGRKSDKDVEYDAKALAKANDPAGRVSDKDRKVARKSAKFNNQGTDSSQ